jgi:hypothetical protein
MNPHLLVGAALPFLIGIVLYLCGRFRASFRMLVVIPLSIALCMTWAIAPDFTKLFGRMDLYYAVHRDPRIDIFFWHGSIDKIEKETPLCVLGFVLLFIAIIVAAWRELHLAEKEH